MHVRIILPSRWLSIAAIAAVLMAVACQAQTIYGYTGSSQTYTVPSGITSIRIKLWGAGGGASANTSGSYGAGGGGGYVQADVPVTPGDTLTILVGQGGASWNSTEGYAGAAYPNGGQATNFGGGGGGRTEVSKSGLLLIAGGGGGGGYQFDGNAGRGGAGGASTGGIGGSSPNNAGGGGGTQSSGGTGGSGTASTGNSGSSKQGGAANGANIPGGGGGDGYYGAGAGGGGLTGSGDSGGGGGGGSNYVSGTGLTNTQSSAGSGSTPGNSSDSDRGSSGASAMGNYGPGDGATTATYRGGNGKVVILALPSVPVISSSLSYSRNQGQSVSYQITASGSPTSYGASSLPSGVSLNTATGLITGTIPSNGGTTGSNSTVNSTITATNSIGTDSKTLVWSITAAAITTNGSASPATVTVGDSVALTRDGTANFGINWTENVIWLPGGGTTNLGNLALGSQSYTPSAGVGTYSYQFRVVDNYYNFKDQWITFTVAVPAPTGFASTSVQSYSVSLSWSATSGAAGYNIYRNGVKMNTGGLITGTSYTDTTALPGTAYSYTVRSVTSGGAESVDSSVVGVTTASSFEVFTPLH